jgi:hypothetical protein
MIGIEISVKLIAAIVLIVAAIFVVVGIGVLGALVDAPLDDMTHF